MEECNLIDLSRELRLSALEMAFNCGRNGSHLGAGLSSIELFAALYGSVLNYDALNPEDENRDRLVVSKGHCVLAYYSALHYAGFLSKDDLKSFETNGSPFHGHATRDLLRGIEFSGGSLSMGMSFAVGLALSCKRKHLGSRVFTLIGDGECDEGLIWESAMAAGHFRLDNFTVIVDKNGLQYDGPTSVVMDSGDLENKFKSFGFATTLIDGHDPYAIAETLQRHHQSPHCLIAHTIKGKGVSFMEGNKEWHHNTLNQAQYEQARREVENV